MRLVRLEGLGATEVEVLARAVGGEHAALPPAALLRRRSGGNPLFVNELVGMIVRSGDPSGVPTGVWAVIGRRLEELSAEAVDVLSIAAVIGAEFDLSVLERAAGPAPATSLGRWTRRSPCS